MIQLEVGKRYWHVVLFPVAVRVKVLNVKKYLFLQKVTVQPVHGYEGGPYTVWSTTAGFSEDEFIDWRNYDGNE